MKVNQADDAVASQCAGRLPQRLLWLAGATPLGASMPMSGCGASGRFTRGLAGPTACRAFTRSWPTKASMWAASAWPG